MIQGREKDKKLKPMKQPSKPAKPLQQTHKQVTQSQARGDTMQRSKLPASMAASLPAEQPKISTLENVCTGLLQMGCVQAYIDLFYTSHKCLPNVMQKKNYFGQNLHIPQVLDNQNEQHINFCKDLGETLTRCEVRHESMRDQKEAAMNQCNSLAFNYQDQGDYVTACYFYNRVIEIATSCKNKQFELVALLGLGKCHDQQNETDTAIDILEGAFDDAVVLDNEEQRIEMTKLIGKELIEMYIKKASHCEKINLQLGLEAYQNALKIAKRSNELQSEARISHKIGELYYEEAKFQQSIGYQVNYLDLLKRCMEQELQKENAEIQMGEKKDNTQQKINLKFKEMEAHASLAKCYLKLKSIEKAEEHLNFYHKMAKQAKAQNAVADSSYYLAKLFEEKGDKEKAVSFYQSYFQAAKSEKTDKKDRKLVDRARVTFAIAKANRNIQKYIGIMGQEDSLQKVLDWKIKRVLK